MTSEGKGSVPEHLLRTYTMIRCAFPQGIPAEDYFPLLAILREQMGFRSIAHIVSIVTEKSYEEAYNDGLRVESTDIPSPEAVAKVKKNLIPCDYPSWLNNDNQSKVASG